MEAVAVTTERSEERGHQVTVATGPGWMPGALDSSR